MVDDFCTFMPERLAMPTGVGNTEGMTNTQTTSIYEVPEIASLMAAWKATITPALPKGDVHAHNAWVQAVKMEQVRRGQRTKMTYATSK